MNAMNLHDTPPSPLLLALESRSVLEMAAFFSAWPWLRQAPRGDGHPVLVLPGLTAGDWSTQALRAYLAAQGYVPYGWGQGPNRGPRPGVEAKMRAQLDEIAQRHGRKVSLIGWSLGGLYARELAWDATDRVRAVITLGSMFAGGPNATNVRPVYEALSGRRIEDLPARRPLPPPVPSTAIYSRSDGIVAWEGCREQPSPTTENIEVHASHSGLGHHPAALYAIADRLAQPEGHWQPFRRDGLRAYLYPDPDRPAQARLGSAQPA